MNVIALTQHHDSMICPQTHVAVHPHHPMDTQVPALELLPIGILSITTVTVGIVVVAAPTEDVNLVVPGQELPRCV